MTTLNTDMTTVEQQNSVHHWVNWLSISSSLETTKENEIDEGDGKQNY
jgi:hypothetical protein